MADLNWQFPRDIGTQNTVNVQPYMILTSYESKNAISSVGVTPDTPRGRPISSIALYIPPNSLRQTTDANWEGVEAGALRAGAMAAAGKITGLEKLMAGCYQKQKAGQVANEYIYKCRINWYYENSTSIR